MTISEMLARKVVFVSGGARGMGAAHVRRMAEQGARVHFGDIADELGEKYCAELSAVGLDVTYHHLDVTDSSNWAGVMDSISEAEGRLDALVNNAGVLDLAGLASIHRCIGWSQGVGMRKVPFELGRLVFSTH